MISLCGAFDQQAAAKHVFLTVRLQPDCRAPNILETAGKDCHREHGHPIHCNLAAAGRVDGTRVLEPIKEGRLIVRMDPELMTILDKEDPSLELWLPTVPNVGHICREGSQLDSGEHGGEAAVILCGGNGNRLLVSIGWLILETCPIVFGHYVNP